MANSFVEPRGLLRIEDAFWEVRSVLLGALKQEGVIEVRRIGVSAPSDSDGFATLTHCPDLMVRRMIEHGVATYYPPPATRWPS